MLGRASASALVFHDPDFASELLTGLEAEPRIHAACIYADDGTIFARYARGSENYECPASPPEPGHQFHHQCLEAFMPIYFETSQVGTLFIRSDLCELSLRLRRYLGIAVLVLMASLAMALSLSRVFRRMVTLPILELEKTATRIAEDKEFSSRAIKYSDDELGRLTDTFNEMLRQIQVRDTALRTSEEKFRTLYASSRDAIMTLTPAGGFLSGNPATLAVFGCQDEEKFLAQTPLTLSPEYQADGAVSSEKIQRMMAIAMDKGAHAFEWMHTRMSGQEFPADVLLTRMEVQGRGIFQATVRDISVRKRTEKELEQHREHLEEIVAERTQQLQEMQEELVRKERLAILGHFSGSISHELRNPLATIDSSVYYLTMILQDHDPKVDEHLRRMKTSIDLSTSIIESLLNLTRMKQPVTTATSVSAIIGESLQTSKVPDTVEVIQDLAGQDIFIEVDREQLRMACKNIIKNAVDAMNRTGTLTITVRAPTAQRVAIAFHDTGSGIAPEHLHQIFQPLFTTKMQGIGFGLSITKMIIENHQGNIQVNSEPGKETEFTVFLPRHHTTKERRI